MKYNTIEAAKILVVDDEPANVLLLQRLLETVHSYQITCVMDPRQVLMAYTALEPDLIMLDLHMPHLDGFAVLNQLEPLIGAEQYVPILVLTADVTRDSKRRALASGALDFLTKPFDTDEVLLRTKNLLHTRFLHLALQAQNMALEDRVRERTRQIEEAHREILERLALAAEYRDDITGKHTKRVGDLSACIARELDLPPDQVEMIRLAAQLHDLGKIGVPDEILGKPGRLSQDEFERMKTHCDIGSRILAGGSSALLQLAEEIALTHHEQWAGSGYPRGLAGESIPLAGRIVAVADVFDALTHARPYKLAWPVAQAVAEIQRMSGTQFDPGVVEALAAVLRCANLQESRQLVA